METLRLVDVADDGQLVLMSGDGRRFVLPVDAEVRAAVRRDRARTRDDDRVDRPGPREVQARIRAGADADEVAAATGLEVDYVRRFEGPVLAERRHVAELGRALPVHRDPGARPSSLETVVVTALTDAGHDADRISWDSRRVEGTRWDVEVVAGMPERGEDGEGDGGPAHPTAPAPVRATWRIDVATRSIEEVDDTARRLTALDRRRLSPVRDRVFDIEAGRSRRQQQAGADVTASTTASILEALALQRGRRPGEVRGDDPDRGSGTGQIAAAALRPDHHHHHDADHRNDELPHGAPSHDDAPHDGRDTVPAVSGERPEGTAGRGARVATFTPRRAAQDVAPVDEPLPLDGLDPTGEAPDSHVPDGDSVSGRDNTDDTGGTVADTSADTSAYAPDFHEEFPVPAVDATADGPTIDPSLLGELDLDAPPRPRAHPVRRNGSPAGPRTVPSPAPARRNGGDGSPPDTLAPPREAPSAEQAPPAAARRPSRRRRAAVPSWDDIVFGARVDDD